MYGKKNSKTDDGHVSQDKGTPWAWQKKTYPQSTAVLRG